MSCPTDEPKTVTQPRHVMAVTLSAITGRVNVHLDDGLDMVYKAKTLDSSIQNNLAQIATMAYITDTKVSITWEGGKDIGTDYCQRWMIRITLEGKRGLIPWDGHRESP